MINLIRNTPKDELELKVAIADLIPEHISVSDLTLGDKIVGHSFHWINQESLIEGNAKLTIPMTEREWLHAVHLVEQKLDVNIHSPDSPRYAYARELYIQVSNQEIQPCRASWKDRAHTLIKVALFFPDIFPTLPPTTKVG